MTILELKAYVTNERKWISTRLATIDKLLDRAAYNRAADTEDLVEKSDALEKKRDKLATAEKLIDTSLGLEHLIAGLETRADTLSCYPRNSSQIEEIYAEIEELESKRNTLIEEINVLLEFNNNNNNKQTNKR